MALQSGRRVSVRGHARKHHSEVRSRARLNQSGRPSLDRSVTVLPGERECAIGLCPRTGGLSPTGESLRPAEMGTRGAAMIDRLVHHAEILALKGDSYRLKDRDLARAPAEN
jgi:hypothetical protein